MNFIENESPEKLRGGYYTPADIATFLARWVVASGARRVLEPSAGDGAFVHALAAVGGSSLRELVACELLESEAVQARAAAASLTGVDATVNTGDFLEWSQGQLTGGPSFDGVVGNPPFIRYQYLDSTLQDRAEKIIRGFGLRFTKHTNAWVPFIVASLALLRPGGRLAMVVPAELLHVLHAQSVRDYLIRECSDVWVLDPEEIWFEGTLQGVVLLFAEKRKPAPGRRFGRVSIQQVRGRSFLQRDPQEVLLGGGVATPGEVLPGKWMLALLNQRQRSLLLDLEDRDRVSRFSDVAKVSVGIVTGANKFFLVPDSTVDEFGLHDFAYPMFGRSKHVPGVIYDDDVHEANKAAGRPTNFIYFNGTARNELQGGPLKYVESGENQRLHTRYKCRIRSPWFTVPSVFTAPVGMLKRSHDYPRLVLNAAGAYTTDTAYRIVPKTMPADQLVFSFVNSLTALTAELEGRHYGGGVLELVPSEINRLLVPRPVNGGHDLQALDQACRRNLPPDAVFAQQDAKILGSLGLAPSDVAELQNAWWTLRNRRQRTGYGSGPPAASKARPRADG